MRTRTMHSILAAAMVLLAGVAIASAETIKLKVMKGDGDQQVTVVIHDITETISLEDLADGEERRFAEGQHTIVVRRDGDRLVITLDGEEIAAGCCGSKAASMVWVGEHEGEARTRVVVMTGSDMAGAHAFHVDEDMVVGGDPLRHIVVKVLDDEGRDLLDSKELEDLDIEITTGDHGMIWVSDDGTVTRIGGDKVRFRCEEDGSELIVDKERATQESYVDPVTGCVMERVEEPEVKVMTVVKECIDEDDDE